MIAIRMINLDAYGDRYQNELVGALSPFILGVMMIAIRVIDLGGYDYDYQNDRALW